MALVEKSVLVLHPCERMFDLVADVERYPSFLPWCSGSEVHLRESLPGTDGEMRVVATLHILYRGLSQQFTTENVERRPGSIRLALRDGPFRRLDGLWTFSRLRDDACKVSFRIEYEFASRLLESLVGPVFGHISNSFVDSFVRRADAVEREVDAR